jgi:hypothetical protein
MIKKAYEELSRTTEKAFNERLITGFTMACDPTKIDVAKRAIFDFLSELSEQLSAERCTEVYQCNIQLFPLTKTEEAP